MKDINNNIDRERVGRKMQGEHVSNQVFVCGQVEERVEQRRPSVMT